MAFVGVVVVTPRGVAIAERLKENFPGVFSYFREDALGRVLALADLGESTAIVADMDGLGYGYKWVYSSVEGAVAAYTDWIVSGDQPVGWIFDNYTDRRQYQSKEEWTRAAIQAPIVEGPFSVLSVDLFWEEFDARPGKD